MVDRGRAWATKYSHAQLGSDGDHGLILDALCWLRAIYHFALPADYLDGFLGCIAQLSMNSGPPFIELCTGCGQQIRSSLWLPPERGDHR
jgi:hypothetical protein